MKKIIFALPILSLVACVSTEMRKPTSLSDVPQACNGTNINMAQYELDSVQRCGVGYGAVYYVFQNGKLLDKADEFVASLLAATMRCRSSGVKPRTDEMNKCTAEGSVKIYQTIQWAKEKQEEDQERRRQRISAAISSNIANMNSMQNNQSKSTSCSIIPWHGRTATINCL